MPEQEQSFEELQAALQFNLTQWDSEEFNHAMIDEAMRLAVQYTRSLREETAASQAQTITKDLALQISKFDEELAKADDDKKANLLAKAKVGFKRAFQQLLPPAKRV